jgi:hypothetical protein
LDSSGPILSLDERERGGERKREEGRGAALNGEMKESDRKLEAVCFFIEEDVPKYHSFSLYLQNNHCLGLPQS